MMFSALFFAAGWWLRPDAGAMPTPVLTSWAAEMQQQRQQLADAPDAFDDLVFVVGDYFNAFERDAEREAPAGEIGGVCVDCLFSFN